jgi:hypothetical protein
MVADGAGNLITLNVSGSEYYDSGSGVVDKLMAISVTGSIIPEGSGSWDLGSEDSPFRHLYITNESLIMVDPNEIKGSGKRRVHLKASDISDWQKGVFDKKIDPTTNARLETPIASSIQNIISSSNGTLTVSGSVYTTGNINASGQVNTGNLYVDGFISASGAIYANGNIESAADVIAFSAGVGAANTGSSDVGDIIFEAGDDFTVTATDELNLTGNTINLSGPVTASGTIVGSNLSGTNTGDQDLSSYLTNSDTGSMRALTVVGNGIINLTTQGDISMSGAIYASEITSSGDISAIGDLKVDGDNVDFTNLPTSSAGANTGGLYKQTGVQLGLSFPDSGSTSFVLIK